MGKKNKKRNGSIWDLTVDEQLEMAERNNKKYKKVNNVFGICDDIEVDAFGEIDAIVSKQYKKKKKHKDMYGEIDALVGGADDGFSDPADVPRNIFGAPLDAPEDYSDIKSVANGLVLDMVDTASKEEPEEPLELTSRELDALLAKLPEEKEEVQRPVAKPIPEYDEEDEGLVCGFHLDMPEEPEEAEYKVTEPKAVEPEGILKIKVFSDLNRLLLDDGISPLPCTLDYLDSLDIVDGVEEMDKADILDHVSDIWFYLVSTMHPTAIFTEDEFKKAFEDISNTDSTKYIFYKSYGYILAYAIDLDGYDKFEDFLISKKLTDFDTLKIYVNWASTANMTNNVFFAANELYIDRVYESYKKQNRQDAFVSMVYKDELTEFFDTATSELEDDVMKETRMRTFAKRHTIIDTKALQLSVQDALRELTDDDDFGAMESETLEGSILDELSDSIPTPVGEWSEMTMDDSDDEEEIEEEEVVEETVVEETTTTHVTETVVETIPPTPAVVEKVTQVIQKPRVVPQKELTPPPVPVVEEIVPEEVNPDDLDLSNLIIQPIRRH